MKRFFAKNHLIRFFLSRPVGMKLAFTTAGMAVLVMAISMFLLVRTVEKQKTAVVDASRGQLMALSSSIDGVAKRCLQLAQLFSEDETLGWAITAKNRELLLEKLKPMIPNYAIGEFAL